MPFATFTSLSALLSFYSFTANMHAAVITKRLKAADPTIVEAPSSPGHPPRFPVVSITASKISGALEPRAIRVKFATVGFQTFTFLVLIT